MNRILRNLAALIAIVPAAASWAANPVVSNVAASQRTDGSGLVDVTYDLADTDGGKCTISINASGDGGLTWYLPCLTHTGDVGDDVVLGMGKHAVWDFGHDNAGWSGDDFQVQVIASDYGFSHQAYSPHTYAAHHWGPSNWADPSFIEKISRADLLTITSHQIWDNGSAEALLVVDLIKDNNPDCKVLSYITSESVLLEWADDTPGSYSRNLYDQLLPYWSYTTTGDTLSNWPGVVVLNILDETCRQLIISNYVDYHNQSTTRLDGVFWDYYADYVWIPDFVDCEGDVDLDQDGIPMLQDPDELDAYYAAQEDIILSMRSAMGNDFIQVCNGVRAQRDSVFAALIDGINYEIFPTMRFVEPDEMRDAFNVETYYSLWHSSNWCRVDAGGPYVLLENIQQYVYFDYLGVPTKLDSGDIFRVIGLLIDNIYPVWDSIGIHNWDWPDVLVSLGEPLGPSVIDGEIYTRAFTYGDVGMEMVSGEWPNPFRYRITVNGNIVEEFDLPYHFP